MTHPAPAPVASLSLTALYKIADGMIYGDETVERMLRHAAANAEIIRRQKL